MYFLYQHDCEVSFAPAHKAMPSWEVHMRIFAPCMSNVLTSFGPTVKLS